MDEAWRLCCEDGGAECVDVTIAAVQARDSPLERARMIRALTRRFKWRPSARGATAVPGHDQLFKGLVAPLAAVVSDPARSDEERLLVAKAFGACTRAVVPASLAGKCLEDWVAALVACSAQDSAPAKLVKRCVRVLLDLGQAASAHRADILTAVESVVSRGVQAQGNDEQVMSLCFDYLAGLAGSAAGRTLMGEARSSTLARLAFSALRQTEDDRSLWAENPEEYVRMNLEQVDLDDQGGASEPRVGRMYSVRASALSFLEAVCLVTKPAAPQKDAKRGKAANNHSKHNPAMQPKRSQAYLEVMKLITAVTAAEGDKENGPTRPGRTSAKPTAMDLYGALLCYGALGKAIKIDSPKALETAVRGVLMPRLADASNAPLAANAAWALGRLADHIAEATCPDVAFALLGKAIKPQKSEEEEEEEDDDDNDDDDDLVLRTASAQALRVILGARFTGETIQDHLPALFQALEQAEDAEDGLAESIVCTIVEVAGAEILPYAADILPRLAEKYKDWVEGGHGAVMNSALATIGAIAELVETDEDEDQDADEDGDEAAEAGADAEEGEGETDHIAAIKEAIVSEVAPALLPLFWDLEDTSSSYLPEATVILKVVLAEGGGASCGASCQRFLLATRRWDPEFVADALPCMLRVLECPETAAAALTPGVVEALAETVSGMLAAASARAAACGAEIALALSGTGSEVVRAALQAFVVPLFDRYAENANLGSGRATRSRAITSARLHKRLVAAVARGCSLWPAEAVAALGKARLAQWLESATASAGDLTAPQTALLLDAAFALWAKLEPGQVAPLAEPLKAQAKLLLDGAKAEREDDDDAGADHDGDGDEDGEGEDEDDNEDGDEDDEEANESQDSEAFREQCLADLEDFDALAESFADEASNDDGFDRLHYGIKEINPETAAQRFLTAAF